MFNKPFLSLHWLSAFALMLFVAGFLCAGSHAQATPTIASFATGLNPGSGGNQISAGTVPNVAIDSFGDVLAVDDVNGALYEYPASGASGITLVPSGGLVSKEGETPGIAIDSSNNLYIEGGTCVLMYPYPWSQLSALSPSATSASVCGAAAPTFINLGSGTLGWGIAIDGTNLLVGTSSSAGNSIISVPVTGAWSAPVAGTPVSVISGMGGPAISISVDPSANIYFVESGSSANPGAFEIPAGQTGLTTDTNLTRIDPSLPQVTGVAADNLGNVYFSDAKNGLYMLPLGSTSSSAALLLAAIPAQGTAAFFSSGSLYVPTQQVSAGVSQVAFNAAQFSSLAVGSKTPESGTVIFSFNNAAGITPGTIEVLEAGKANPDFVLASSGSTCVTQAQSSSVSPDPLPYTALTSCTVKLSFSPQATGAVSAMLEVLDQKNNQIAFMPLTGIGVGGAVQVLPATQSAVDGGLMAPGQIAVDAAGNLYVADSGLGQVEMFAAGSGAKATAITVGQNLKAPTGVAVDGAGDVFIADSGNVYEVPETASGLNSKGQVTLKSGLGAVVTLAADGLGNLYVADISNQAVYELQDLSAGSNAGLPPMLNSQTITLSGAAFSTPSDIAVDSQNNLYVVNGAALYEVTPSGTQTSVLTGLSNVTGLAVDPSGSVYVSATAGTVRIPNVSGTLSAAGKTPVASGVTNPTSVAIDSMGNVYVADGSALNVNLTTASTAVNFGTVTTDPTSAPPPAGSSSTQTVTLLNYGNAPLMVTGYNSPISNFDPISNSTDPNDGVPYAEADFAETADTCSGNSIAVNSTCQATITFSPAPGDGGTLTGQVLVQGNLGNEPVGVNGTGVAPTLSGTTTTMTASATGTIEGVPVSVAVAPNASGSSAPTGTVTLTVQYGNNVPLINCGVPSCILSTLPPKYQYTATLSNGTATFDPIELPIANYTFTARYNGDTTYVYGNSSNSGAVAVANPVPTVLNQPPVNASAVNTPPSDPTQVEPYTLPCTSGSGSSCTTTFNYDQPSGNPPGYLVLATGTGSREDYNNDAIQGWGYTYPVNITSASSDPLVGLAVYGNPTCPSGSSCETAWNWGAVNYVMANGQSVCGQAAGSKSIVNVADDGTAPFTVSCVGIDTSNTTIPNILTYYSVTPQYSGTFNDLVSVNPNYQSAKGQTFGLWAVVHPLVQISSNPPALTVNSGSTVSSTLTVTSILGYGFAGRTGSQNNYSLPLDLQCQGLPSYATCTFTYSTPNAADPNFQQNPGGLLCAGSTSTYCAVDIGPNPGTVPSRQSSSTPCGPVDGCLGPGTVTMTITTNVPIGTTSSKVEKGKGGIAFAALLGLGLFGLTFRRKAARWDRLLMVACLVLFGGAFAGLTACSTTNLGTQSTAAVTPSGTYWVTITAKQAGSIAIKCGTPSAACVNGIEIVPAQEDQMSLPYTVNLTIGQ